MSTDPTGHLSTAMRAFEARKRDEAAQALRNLIEARPPIGKTWGAVARMAATLGEIDSAIAASRLLVDVSPEDDRARLELGQYLAQYGRHSEAIKIGETLQRDQPRNPAGWHFTGVCRIEVGDAERGVSDLRRALELSTDPEALAWTWQTIAGAKRFVADDPDLVAMQALLGRLPSGESGNGARAVLLYAIGKALDDTGQTDAAFAAYAEGAALTDRLRPESLAASDAFVDSIIQGFDRTLTARLEGKGCASDRPVFVLGMPRSGTTLVEQILVSHPDVKAGAEINLFSAAAMPVGGFTPSAVGTFNAAQPDGLRSIGRAYLNLLDQRFGPGGRVVDKTLSHTRLLGMIQAVLPDAKVIWLQRSPGAVAWSCFRTRFARGLDWTWSLENIARYMKAEDRLHAHWTRLLPDTILTVPYEELVSDPETWIPRIADHVGLTATDAMLTPHLTERAVPSASYAQVRQPINTGSVEAWRRYETQLKPFFDAYGAG